MKIKFLLVSIAATGLMFAQGRANFGRPGGGPAGPDTEARLTKTLNLNATQQNAVHTALQEHRVATQGLGEQMHTLNTQLHAAIKSGATDQIDTISASIANVHQQQIASQAKAAAKIYSTLTADQKTQLGDHIEMLMGGPGMGRGPGGPAPAGAARRGPPAAQN
ncbi:MAG TPA: periplasmic heavy metal sensor [Bryobacteraceae bacterium]|nr:periplasmic heavy metal sensor [Bryobacteraceae bacterium]